MIAFWGGITITASGIALAVIRHRQSDNTNSIDDRIERLLQLSTEGSEIVKDMNRADIPFKVYRTLCARDIWSMYRNSRIIMGIASKLVEEHPDEDLRFEYDKINKTHDKLFWALLHCLIEKVTKNIGRYSFGVYTGVATWLYNEQVSLIEILSAECLGNEHLTEALEALY